MNQTSAQQWTALSALYEQADELPPAELPGWLAALRRAGHPLLPQLQRMLSARAQIETDDFLVQLPKIVPVAPAPAGPLWTAGSRVGAWRLVRPLGEGGMAEVWLAERDDGAFARRVAIKLPFPRPGREGLAARFDRERDILASLRHPHIAGLFDAGVTAQGQAWLALEYVEGVPLSVHCDRRHLPVRERVALFRQVLLAVQHAHANLVIHRDLKPGNILVTAQGEARLLDFGIAKLLEAEGGEIAETELTRAAGRSLTPRYASPEQLTGRPLTIACDVYALGVVLYELLCGERPYEVRADSAAQLEQAILEVEPRAPSRRTGNSGLAADRGATPQQLRRVLCPELDAIVLRCLRKPVTERYSSVDALLADVDRWLAGEAVLARAPSPWYRFIKFTLRHRLGMGMGAAALAALVGMTTVATVFGLHAREESARAVASRDFMLELFRGADREKSHGADITARELLQTGRRDVLSQLAGQPRLQTDLLAGIAAIQFDMGEYASADSTFSDVVRLAEHSGQEQAKALALTGQADTAVRLGDLKRARDLLGLVRAMPIAATAEIAMRIDIVEGWIDAYSDQLDRARSDFEKARTLAGQVEGPPGPEALAALRGAISVERLQMRYDQALAMQEELEAIVRGQWNVKPRELAALAFRRSDLIYAAGRYAQGWLALSQATTECSAALGPHDEVCRRITLLKLKARMRMGFADADPDAMQLAETVADDPQMPIERADALYVLLRMAAASESEERQQSIARRVQSVLNAPKGTPDAPNLANRVKLVVGLAEAALLMGDSRLAAAKAADALAIASAEVPSAGPTPWTATALLVQAISLRLAGDAEESLHSMSNAREQICSIVGQAHPMCAVFQLDIAVLLADAGRNEEAQEIALRVGPLIEQTFGTSSPLQVRLLALEKELSLRSKLRGRLGPGSAPLPYIFI